MKKYGARMARGIAAGIFWLLVWQGLSMLVDSALLLPSPGQTAQSLLALMRQAQFWRSTCGSLLRVLAGYLCAVLFGSALGALTAALPAMEALLRPLRGIIKATPVAAMILLVNLWLKSNIVPAFMAFLMVLPLVWANVQEGARATNAQLLEMAKLFRFSKWKKFHAVYIPSVMPQFMSACATGLGFAWKAGVAAEVLARTANSIGRLLVESKSNLLTADMFAWTAVVVLLSILLEKLVVWLLNRTQGSTKRGVRA